MTSKLPEDWSADQALDCESNRVLSIIMPACYNQLCSSKLTMSCYNQLCSSKLTMLQLVLKTNSTTCVQRMLSIQLSISHTQSQLQC